jgi:intein/homing endonuclease
MAVASPLKYPKKSHRKVVLLPKYSVKLAEFFGLMLGDGGINNSWQANITVNAIKDKKYSVFISKLCDGLFGISPAIYKRKGKQALIISLASTTIVDFLVDNGLPRGDKLKGGLKIPSWILVKKSYRIACVRGLIDTDGCLFVHKHKISGKVYKNIGLCFTSYSVELIFQVASVFEECGIPALH